MLPYASTTGGATVISHFQLPFCVIILRRNMCLSCGKGLVLPVSGVSSPSHVSGLANNISYRLRLDLLLQYKMQVVEAL
jgi:hypothetical protein